MPTPDVALPAWILDEFQAFFTGRLTGSLTVYFHEGDVREHMETAVRRSKPIGGIVDGAPCPLCIGRTHMIERGTRIRCAPCQQTWTEIEYRTLVNRAIREPAERG